MGMLFYFFNVRSTSEREWVILFILLGRNLLAPYSKPYPDRTNNFLRFKGRDIALMVMNRETGAPHFPLSRTSDSKVSSRFSFDELTPFEWEAVQEPSYF